MSTSDPQAASAAVDIDTVSFTENDLEKEDSPLNNKSGEHSNGNNDKEIPTIVIDTTDENKDDRTVTLRRKEAHFCEQAEAVTVDDYRYLEYLQPQSTFRRKEMIGSEKMISDAELRFAATLVHDAMEGRTVDIKTEARYVRSYNLYKSWPLTYLLYAAISVNLSLVLFEEPADPALSLPIHIRRAWRNMRRTIKEIIHVVVLFYFFIFVFALIAFQIFSSREDIKYPDGRPYFKTYFECVWELYVLVTTSNNPDVMIPALTKSRFYCIFFSVYIVVCFYMLLNVFLAVAYHSYNENMKDEIRRSSREKKKKLGQAFDVIKIDHNGMDMVTYRTWKRLMKLAKPGLSKNQVDLLMLILDMDNSGHIGRREFMNVADLLNVPVSEVEDRIIWLEKVVPQLYNSRPSEYLKFFKLMYDIIVLIEIFLIGFAVKWVSVPFCILYSIEILLKVYTFGPKLFDVAITSLALVFLVIGSAYTPTVLANGFVLVTTKAARAIMTAFIVDMFMYEYTIQKEGKVDSTVEKKIKELGLGIDAETSYVNKRKSSIPTLNRFDGIRFHIKKKGWTKIEVLLQQLYDVECDVDTTIDFKDRSEENRAKSMLV
ncbi:TPC1-like protein [Mya arenaria]|uniref:TPC1-like protein n=1 Tax=Mya arenaria TaxID=6604 RepID=A0ABY7FEM2_MYAAR|nr:TPC1-like protein [Mya arenaria]